MSIRIETEGIGSGSTRQAFAVFKTMEAPGRKPNRVRVDFVA